MLMLMKNIAHDQGRIQDFFRKGCTCLLLYFNTNKPHSFFLQNTSCIRKPQVISGRGGCAPPAPPLDPPLVTQKEYSLNLENHCSPVSLKLLFHCFPHKGSQLPFQSLSPQGNPLRINSCSSLLVM